MVLINNKTNCLQALNNRLEKKIGGMWLGELARLIILDLHKREIMFENIETDSMLHKEGLSTAFISQLTQYVINKYIFLSKFFQNFL